MVEEFEAVCASSEDSSGWEDGMISQQETPWETRRKRVRQYLLCDTCKQKVSKSEYYVSHQYGLCNRRNDDQSSDDESITFGMTTNVSNNNAVDCDDDCGMDPSSFEPSLDHNVDNTIPEPEGEISFDTEVNPETVS